MHRRILTKNLLAAVVAAGVLVTVGAASRADYPFAKVPPGVPPSVTLDFDPKLLPDKPGCFAVKAKATIADKTIPFDFQLFLPPGYPKAVGFQDGLVPVLVSLHNRSAIGNEDVNVLGESLQSLLTTRIWDNRSAGERPEHPVTLNKVAPMICIAPHCPAGYSWESPGVAQAVGLLIDAVVPAIHADPDRVCLTGFSYGGSSTWVIAQQIPDRFAAIAVCDGRRTDNPAATAEKLKHVAIYLTVGDRDGDFTNDARIMSAALGGNGHPNFVYREWRNGNHFVYGSTYSDPIFWTWLQGQKRAPLEERRPPPPPKPTPPPTLAPAVAVVMAAPAQPPRPAPLPPPKPRLPHVVIDDKSWPTKPGYFSVHGQAMIGDQSRPMTVSIFLPQSFTAQPDNLPIVVSLQNRGDGAGDRGRARAGLATLLHRGTPANQPATTQPIMNLAQDAHFIALIPHCPSGVDWNTPGVPEMLGDLIQQTVQHYKANPKCISLTGIGNGGTAAWAVATALPQRFAAIAVLDANAPADPQATVRALQHTGIYLTAAQNETPMVKEAQRMREALDALLHHDFILDIMPGDKLAISETVYQDPRFWTWLLSHHR